MLKSRFSRRTHWRCTGAWCHRRWATASGGSAATSQSVRCRGLRARTVVTSASRSLDGSRGHAAVGSEQHYVGAWHVARPASRPVHPEYDRWARDDRRCGASTDGSGASANALAEDHRSHVLRQPRVQPRRPVGVRRERGWGSIADRRLLPPQRAPPPLYFADDGEGAGSSRPVRARASAARRAAHTSRRATSGTPPSPTPATAAERARPARARRATSAARSRARTIASSPSAAASWPALAASTGSS